MTEPKNNGLRGIAVKMRDYATRHPRTNTTGPIDPYRVKLAGGLWIVLYITLQHEWHLSLTRQGVKPSPKEVEIVVRDFDVPGDALRTERDLPDWKVIRFKWTDRSQGKLFEIAPAEAQPPNYLFE